MFGSSVDFYLGKVPQSNVIGIVVSRLDHVSALIGGEMLEMREWVQKNDPTRLDSDGGGTYYCIEGFELREFDKLHIQLENVEEVFDRAKCIVFVSRHVGGTGAILTAHYTGNFGAADFGGLKRELSMACPNAHKAIINALEKYAPVGYEVGIECTHHGPSDITIPSMFVELGSSEKEWGNVEAANAIACAVLEIEGVAPFCEKTIVGFGGGHYLPRFERIIKQTDWSIGHVAADWCLESIDSGDKEIIKKIFEKSCAKLALVVNRDLDLVNTIENMGYEVVNEKWIRETSGINLEFVSRIENAMMTIENGLRFGSVRSDQIEIIEMNKDLLLDVQVVDCERVVRIMVDNTIAFETIQNGSIVSGKIAVESKEVQEIIIDEFCKILGLKYKSVKCEENKIIVKETVFDSEKARGLGIENGLEFGKLASGESVKMGNRLIRAEDVFTEKIKIYSIWIKS